MTPYDRLLSDGRIRAYRSTPQEVADLFGVVERDLADATVEGISTDRRFAIAYNAALQCATIVMHCEGYRTKGEGHYAATLTFARIALGPAAEPVVDYLDYCRNRRNRLDYHRVEHISESEAANLLVQASAFRDLVRSWVDQGHQEMTP
jgi:hypothetical protein